MTEERTSIRDGAPAGGSALEDLLVEALDLLGSEGTAGIERWLAVHPREAPQIRAHLERLHDFGLVPPASGSSMEPTALRAEFPERLGDFRLLARLGAGGMGVVFLAEQEKLGRRVALKLIRNELLYFPGARERFEREVRAISRLQHPGIVPVHAAGEDAGVPWLAMDYVAGVSIDEALRHLEGREPARLRGSDLQAAAAEILRGRAPSLREIEARPDAARGEEKEARETAPLFHGPWTSVCLRIARALAEALAHAHERGVLHRDVKPSNVMLTLDGRVQLLDFGLARSAGSAKLTGTGSQLGSPAYMSPEQVRGEAQRIDARTDVYSLGVTLYELLALRAPFSSDSTEGLRRLVIGGRTPPLRAANTAVPRDLEVVCRTAMDLEIERRYPDMAAFARDLENVRELRPISARAPSAWLAARRWSQRHPARAVLLVAGLLLALVVPTGFWIQQSEANARIRVALEATRKSRDRALEAVDVLLMRVATEELLDTPRMQHVRLDLLGRARDFCEQFLAESAGDPDLAEQTARTTLRLAMLDNELGRIEQALVSSERAIALSRDLLARKPRDVVALALLGESLGVRSAALHLRARFAEGLILLEESARHYRELFEIAPENLPAAVDCLGFERSRVFLLVQLGRHEEAAQAAAEFWELWEDLAPRVANTPFHSAALSHAVCACADQAHFHAQIGQAEDSRAVIERGEELAAAGGSSELSTTAELGLVRMEVVRSKLARAENDFEAMEAHLETARERILPILERLPGLATARRTLAAIRNDLGTALMRDPVRAAEGRDLLRESITELESLLELDPEVVEPRGNVAAGLVKLGSSLRDAGQHAEALPVLERALSLAEAVCIDAPSVPMWRNVVFNALWHLSLVHGELRDHAAQADSAERLSRWQAADPRVQRISAGLVASAARLAAADERVSAAERSERAAELDRRALGLLEDAAAKGCRDAEWVKTAPELEVVRAMPGFDEVLRKIEGHAAKAAEGAPRQR